MSTIRIENRINWIDWAKVIAITLVVFGHVPQEKGSFVQNYIVQFHMPLFFFISGYLTKKELFNKTTLKKYWHTLIIPYFCFNIIFYPYWIARHIIDYPQYAFFDFVKPIIGTFLFQLETPVSDSLNGVTWFIAALLVMKIILSYSNKYKHGTIIMCFISLTCAIMFLLNEHYRFCTNLPIMGFLAYTPFYYCGHLCKQKSMIPEKQRPWDWIVCLLGISISIIIYKYERNYPSIYVFAFCFYTIGITAIMGVLHLCKNLDKIHSSILNELSIGTIVIMGLHWMMIGITNFIICKYFHTSEITYTLSIAVLLSLLFVFSSYPIIIFLERKYPFVLGKYHH